MSVNGMFLNPFSRFMKELFFPRQGIETDHKPIIRTKLDRLRKQ